MARFVCNNFSNGLPKVRSPRATESCVKVPKTGFRSAMRNDTGNKRRPVPRAIQPDSTAKNKPNL